MHLITQLHLLGCGENISDTTLLAGDIIIQCFVFFQLDSNDIWVRARRFGITNLTFHLTEPLKQLINVPNNLQ
jgi:intracellular septation protein A